MAKLDLACGPQNKPGYVHHENIGATKILPHVDIEHDLNVFPWPWKEAEFEEVRAEDIVEHLPSLMPFMDECWRILKKGGKLFVRTPSWDADFAHIDPTHIRLYALDTFDFWDPESAYGKYNVHLGEKKWKLVDKHKSENGNLFFELEKR